MVSKSDEYYCMIMQNERFETFMAQNFQNGCFDVTFKIENKLVHAHKSILALVSETFKAMFSESWNKKDVIEVQTYSFEKFNDLLKFIYSGKCELNGENIGTMVDMSEFYNINALRQKCHGYLLETEIPSEHILKLYENLKKYFSFKEMIESKMIKVYAALLDSNNFIDLQKDTVQTIVSIDHAYALEEKLFKMVYQWAENQATLKYSSNATTDLNECIKDKLQSFLPYIRFNAMNEEFVKTFVVQKGFLFTYEKLSEILCNIKKFKVEITDINGKKLYGDLNDQDFVVDEIEKVKNCQCKLGPTDGCYWDVQRPINFKSKLLKQSPNSNYFLQIGFQTGRLLLLKTIDTNFLLAEFIGENGFDIFNCKIRIV